MMIKLEKFLTTIVFFDNCSWFNFFTDRYSHEIFSCNVGSNLLGT